MSISTERDLRQNFEAICRALLRDDRQPVELESGAYQRAAVERAWGLYLASHSDRIREATHLTRHSRTNTASDQVPK